MDSPIVETDVASEATRKWQPLSSMQRRVFGVLVEKAKTTPDTYPLSLNALTTGCNQKSNRSPQMSLTVDQVEETLEQLREMGAVGEIQTSGRVAKFKHYAYDWLGVNKEEIAVFTELLLRGEQTVGELRGRAARMEPIADLAALRPVLRSLIEKQLVISLTAEGRGQVVTHGLYKPREMEQLSNRQADLELPVAAPVSSPTRHEQPAGEPSAGRTPSANLVTIDMFNQLQLEVAELQAELSRLKRQIGTTQDTQVETSE